MRSMLFTFTTNMTPRETALAIKNTISQIGDSTKGPDSNFVGKHQPIAEERVWDAFIRTFLSLYPKCGANIEPGIIRFDTVKVQDGADVYTYSAITRNTPSIGGAILGGAVAGDIGALIGASAGNSTTTATVTAEKNPKVRVIARYTNGHNQDTELYKGSHRYHEIMINF